MAMKAVIAHAHSSNHRDELLSSELCGRFYCLATFAPDEITDWTDEGTCEICPRCGIDSVMGSRSGFPITTEFLREMNSHWF